MSVLYKIKDWDTIFENHESRKLKNLSWVPVPNKWDGLGFARLRKHKRCAEVLGGWVLILQIASKSIPRGSLCRENLPLSPDDMGDITGVPGGVFSLALNVLSDKSEGICWIDKIEDNVLRLNESETGNSPDMPGNSPAGTEQNRTEKKRTENAPQGLVFPLKFSNSPEFLKTWDKWEKHRKTKAKPKNWDEFFQNQLEWLDKFDLGVAIEILETSTINGYQGLIKPKTDNSKLATQNVNSGITDKQKYFLGRYAADFKPIASDSKALWLDFFEKSDMDTLKRVFAEFGTYKAKQAEQGNHVPAPGLTDMEMTYKKYSKR